MSDDGTTWSSTVTGLIGSYSSTEGWHYDTSLHTVDTDIKNFVQFGVRVKNTTSGTEVASGQVALRITPTVTGYQWPAGGPGRPPR